MNDALLLESPIAIAPAPPPPQITLSPLYLGLIRQSAKGCV